MKLRWFTLSLFCALSGCSQYFASQEAAPVVSIGSQLPITRGYHTVLAGETLYAIAWQYGHDYRDLAQINHIEPPYRIYPGQKIALKGKFTVAKRSTVAKKSDPKQLVDKTVKPAKVEVTKANSPKIEITKAEITKPAVKAGLVKSQEWVWPVKGKLIKTFSKHEHTFSKGVDIAGSLGTPVLSAKEGKVVYSGDGLRGYGQLIIIKHNDTFLSAYAHNQRLLVKEGDSINQGQTIAYMGQSDADRVKLHFEIRKNGQPVDPLLYLSKGV
ncbi:MAG: peptidoglycan DD-metalloendopeptidase family protein [Candidatus Berkiella sp.]